MGWLGSALATVTAALAATSSLALAHADVAVPAAGIVCSAAAQNAMTVLPSGRDFLVCQSEEGGLPHWAPVVTPFPPNDAWLSYGPEVTLHGEGFRNPNLASGEWTATPQNSATQCGAYQVTVIGPGVLAPPQVSQGGPGQTLTLKVLPKLFTIELSGNCLWKRAAPS